MPKGPQIELWHVQAMVMVTVGTLAFTALIYLYQPEKLIGGIAGSVFCVALLIWFLEKYRAPRS